MKETLYRFLGERNPRAKARYEALRQAGAPRWKAAPALLLPGGGGARPLPVGAGESAQSLGEPSAALVQRLARFQAVSFDVFDTLLLRQVERPQEAFALVGAKLGYPDFQRLRVEAERRARDKKRRRAGSGEVTLSEIWQELEAATAIPAGEGMAAELAVERALCRGNPYFLPVVEALRQLGKPLGLLSDMYLPGDFLQQLVEEAGFGLFACCLVSGEEGVSKGEGGLYQRWKGRFPPDAPLAHVGDNPHADGEMARVQGIVPMLYPGVHQAGGPYRARDMSAVVGSLYRGVVNGKLHNGSQAYSPLYEYGYVYGGLFALGYCRFIRAWAEHSGADRLLFLSRDGEALLALYRRLYPQDSRPVYAYWSRLAAAKVCAGLFPADYFRRFLWHRAGEGVPLGKLLRGMELTPLLPGLCGALGVFPQTPLTHKNAGAVQDYLQRAWGQVLKNYQPQVRAAGAYYRQLLAGCSHAGAVDIGWAGSGAVSLAAAAKHLWGLECRVTGLVAGTNSAHSPERDAAEPLLLTGDLVSYLFSQSHNRDLWKLHNPRQGHNLFWELLLGGEEGGLRGFSPGEETGWRLELGENSHSGAVGEIHRGLLDFAQDFTDLEKRLGLPLAISGRDAYAPMLEVLARRNAPYRRQWEALLDEPGIG